ncbi:hypothetical protein ANO11243_067300 [Dothideomycetidae sp. 11243]|nr:hypothetical protein ANO11243_067300 [fungal sp. No.11243]
MGTSKEKEQKTHDERRKSLAEEQERKRRDQAKAAQVYKRKQEQARLTRIVQEIPSKVLELLACQDGSDHSGPYGVSWPEPFLPISGNIHDHGKELVTGLLETSTTKQAWYPQASGSTERSSGVTLEVSEGEVLALAQEIDLGLLQSECLPKRILPIYAHLIAWTVIEWVEVPEGLNYTDLTDRAIDFFTCLKMADASFVDHRVVDGAIQPQQIFQGAGSALPGSDVQGT